MIHVPLTGKYQPRYVLLLAAIGLLALALPKEQTPVRPTLTQATVPAELKLVSRR